MISKRPKAVSLAQRMSSESADRSITAFYNGAQYEFVERIKVKNMNEIERGK